MKVLVCGDRNWIDVEKIRDRLSDFPQGTIFISGAAPGADTIAAEEMRALHYEVIEFPADWDKYGHAAGPIRNGQMLDQEPGLVIAFHPHLSRSKGTLNMVRQAKQRKVPFEVIT